MQPVQSKKVLVVLVHPDPDSYAAALFSAYVQAAQGAGHQVEALDLGKEQFDPVLRFGYRQHMAPDPFIERSQELVAWADHITLIFPIWWSQLPALLSGWIDRVFAPGFAYNRRPGFSSVKHLKGKGATGIVTSRGPAWAQGIVGSSVKRQVKSLILGYCGIKPVRLMQLGNIGTKKDNSDRRAAFIERVRQAGAGQLAGASLGTNFSGRGASCAG